MFSCFNSRHVNELVSKEALVPILSPPMLHLLIKLVSIMRAGVLTMLSDTQKA
jgi:hypothetical protein